MMSKEGVIYFIVFPDADNIVYISIIAEDKVESPTSA